jgi:hypothetical protein
MIRFDRKSKDSPRTSPNLKSGVRVLSPRPLSLLETRRFPKHQTGRILRPELLDSPGKTHYLGNDKNKISAHLIVPKRNSQLRGN